MATPTNAQFTHLYEVAPVPQYVKSWERLRHRQAHWFAECVAEATGVFFYAYAGGGAAAVYIFTTLASIPGAGSLLTAGFGYGIGAVFAILIATGTSGGHLNPAITISRVAFHGFPIRKAPMYIAAQIFGGYVAFGLIYWQYKDSIKELELLLKLTKGANFDAAFFSPTGPAGAFGLYLMPGSKLGLALLNEFVLDFFIGLVIWTCLDPTNMLISPVAAPWIIGMAYAICIWGFSPNGMSANTARDLGGRLVAISVWGTKASGGKYAAIAALTNIPATMLAAVFYQTFLSDSCRVLNPANKVLLDAHKAHQDELGNYQHGQHGARQATANAGTVRDEEAKYDGAT